MIYRPALCVRCEGRMVSADGRESRCIRCGFYDYGKPIFQPTQTERLAQSKSDGAMRKRLFRG